MKLKGVIYARYSSHQQTERSIEGQVADCMAYAEYHDIDIIETYIDRAMTGTNDKRESFQRMLKDAEKGKFSCVITWKIDRFGRNREELAVNKMKLRKSGVSLLYAKESIPDGPEGVILESVLEGLAEYYSKDLSQKVKRGMHTKALTCRYNGGVVPFGYDIDKNGCYVLNDQAVHVKFIFERFNEGCTFTEIAKDLNRKGIKTSRGNDFCIETIRRIITNKKYKGTFVFDDVEIPEGVPKIVSERLFDSVQEKYNTTKKGPRNRRTDMKYYLIGKVYCGICGAPYVADGGVGKMGTYYGYYACKNRKNHNGCPGKTLNKDHLEDMVDKKIKKALFDDDMVDNIIETAKNEFSKSETQEHIKHLKKELKSAENAIKRLFSAIEKGIIPDQAMDETGNRINELMNQKQDIEYALEDAETSACGVDERVAGGIIKKIKKSKTSQEMINLVVEKIIIDNDVKIILNLNKKNSTQISFDLSACSSSSAMVVQAFKTLNKDVKLAWPYIMITAKIEKK